jgi:hypothetical protein
MRLLPRRSRRQAVLLPEAGPAARKTQLLLRQETSYIGKAGKVPNRVVNSQVEMARRDLPAKMSRPAWFVHDKRRRLGRLS